MQWLRVKHVTSFYANYLYQQSLDCPSVRQAPAQRNVAGELSLCKWPNVVEQISGKCGEDWELWVIVGLELDTSKSAKKRPSHKLIEETCITALHLAFAIQCQLIHVVQVLCLLPLRIDRNTLMSHDAKMTVCQNRPRYPYMCIIVYNVIYIYIYIII